MTKTVMRYSFFVTENEQGQAYVDQQEDPDYGQWVRYEDHERLSKLWEDACKRMSADEPGDEQRKVADDVCIYGIGIAVHTPDGVRRVPPQDVIFKNLPVNRPPGPSVTIPVSDSQYGAFDPSQTQYPPYLRQAQSSAQPVAESPGLAMCHKVWGDYLNSQDPPPSIQVDDELRKTAHAIFPGAPDRLIQGLAEKLVERMRHELSENRNGDV